MLLLSFYARLPDTPMEDRSSKGIKCSHWNPGYDNVDLEAEKMFQGNTKYNGSDYKKGIRFTNLIISRTRDVKKRRY